MKTLTPRFIAMIAVVLLVPISRPASAAVEPRVILKTFFETGDVPTQDQFKDLIDSFINYNDDGLTITGIAQNSSTGAGGRKFEDDSIDVTLDFASNGGPGGVIPSMAPEFGGHSGFLGLRLSDSLSNTYYGYFQLSMDDPLLTDPAGIHVDYFVFNDTPGESLSVTSVPIPAGAWLFGSAFGLLGMRRRDPT